MALCTLSSLEQTVTSLRPDHPLHGCKATSVHLALGHYGASASQAPTILGCLGPIQALL